MDAPPTPEGKGTGKSKSNATPKLSKDDIMNTVNSIAAGVSLAKVILLRMTSPWLIIHMCSHCGRILPTSMELQ